MCCDIELWLPCTLVTGLMLLGFEPPDAVPSSLGKQSLLEEPIDGHFRNDSFKSDLDKSFSVITSERSLARSTIGVAFNVSCSV